MPLIGTFKNLKVIYCWNNSIGSRLCVWPVLGGQTDRNDNDTGYYDDTVCNGDSGCHYGIGCDYIGLAVLIMALDVMMQWK